jgi:membrane protein YdbS with pleckstrin-like domain
MAKVSREKEKLAKRRAKKIEILPLEPINYKIMIAGVAIVVAGYFALGMEPWDGFMALTVAPILLLIGYCVVIPIGIIYRVKKEEVISPVEGISAEPSPQQ